MKPTLRSKILIALLRVPALLPLPVLYVLADVLAFLARHVVRYRRRVVDDNLAASLPELSDCQRRKVSRQFYRNLADYFVETIKLLHISDKQMKRRFKFEGIDVLERLLEADKGVVAYFSHCFNWEWATSVSLWLPDDLVARTFLAQIYHPLNDKTTDALMLKMRSRFGTKSLPMATALRGIIRGGKPQITGFMSDQRPSNADPAYITKFLGRPTAFISGTESLARRLGMAAVYWDMHKDRRGHYRIVCRLLTDDVSHTPEHQVTQLYVDMLEQTIKRNPSIWLWTHRRWKKPVTLPAST